MTKELKDKKTTSTETDDEIYEKVQQMSHEELLETSDGIGSKVEFYKSLRLKEIKEDSIDFKKEYYKNAFQLKHYKGKALNALTEKDIAEKTHKLSKLITSLRLEINTLSHKKEVLLQTIENQQKLIERLEKEKAVTE